MDSNASFSSRTEQINRHRMKKENFMVMKVLFWLFLHHQFVVLLLYETITVILDRQIFQKKLNHTDANRVDDANLSDEYSKSLILYAIEY